MMRFGLAIFPAQLPATADSFYGELDGWATLCNHLPIMITPTRLSYGLLAATIILAGLLHLGVPLLVVLFSYFALRQLYFLTKRKWLALILFALVVAGIAAAAVFLTRAAVFALPDVADTSIPSASA